MQSKFTINRSGTCSQVKERFVTQSCIALLGRRDAPTDAVEEYCRYLGDALLSHDIQLEIRRVPWEIHGWSDSLKALSVQAAGWRNRWVLVQYTALAWSVRGFPQKVLRALKILKLASVRVGVVFHDVQPYPGTRPIDSIRRFVQIHTMRNALRIADLAVFTVQPEKLEWLSTVPPQSAFIPVGPNFPVLPLPHLRTDPIPTIGVFSITGGKAGSHETQIILASVRYASQRLGRVRLFIFGRHAELYETTLREGVRDLPVDLSVEGILEPSKIVQKLSLCDVLLFVRGPISSRRGSAIAGIACGLPVVGYYGSETAAPITDAGVVLVSPDQPHELNAALFRVLSDVTYRTDLAASSRSAYHTHFAWPAIADRFSALLKAQ